MADHSKIEWTDATWNPITGCSVVSPGCTNCYAMRLAGTRLAHHPSRTGLTQDTKAGPVWTGEVRFNEQWLDQPLRWKKPRMIFVCAHGDLFAEGVEDAWLDQIFAVMALCPQHVFQVLTKRPERMRSYLSDRGNAGGSDGSCCAAPSGPRMPTRERIMCQVGAQAGYEKLRWYAWPLPNVWLGVSVEDQKRADERIPILLDTPAAIRWISAEPLLGPVDLTRLAHRDPQRFAFLNFDPWLNALTGNYPALETYADRPHPRRLNWIVAGGESGPGARPMHPDWARSLRDQCAAADVPFHFKQWGEFATVYDRDHEDPDWRRCAVIADDTPRGRWLNLAGGHGFHGERVVRVSGVGKRRAGRQLDGTEHNAFPQVKP